MPRDDLLPPPAWSTRVGGAVAGIADAGAICTLLLMVVAWLNRSWGSGAEAEWLRTRAYYQGAVAGFFALWFVGRRLARPDRERVGPLRDGPAFLHLVGAGVFGLLAAVHAFTPGDE